VFSVDHVVRHLTGGSPMPYILAILTVLIVPAVVFAANPGTQPATQPRPFVQLRADAERGNLEAMAFLAARYLKGSNGAPQGVALLNKAADKGDDFSMKRLGGLYLKGKLVPRDDRLAMLWYRRAADKGEVDSIATVGSMYEVGRGTEQDYTKAMTWYRKAAD